MPVQSRRKNVAVLFAAVACMGAPCPIFARQFPHFVWVWIALMFATLIYAAAEFRKLKKEEDQ